MQFSWTLLLAMCPSAVALILSGCSTSSTRPNLARSRSAPATRGQRLSHPAMQGTGDGMGALSTPRASPLALQTLRDMASIRAVVTEMQQMVRPAAEFGFPVDSGTAPLSATLQDGLAELNYRVAALRTVMNSSAWGGQLLSPAGPSEDLKTLRSQAQRLQRETGSQQQLLMILEEQEGGSVERTKEVFEMMDINGDGRVSEEEFLRGATQLLDLNKAKNAQLRNEMSARFRSGAEPPSDGAAATMDFDRFCSFLGTVRGDAVGPLRLSYGEQLRQLLDVSMQMTALTLSREMVGPDMTSERVAELSEYVDLWIDIQDRATASLAAGAPADDVLALLEEVSALATTLSLPSCSSDVGCAVDSNARKAVRATLATLSKFRSSLSFCGRGLQITGRDVWEVAVIFTRWLKGSLLTDADNEMVRRTVTDVLMLVPYTIIMVVPLTPPGHVFAFSLLNRCFPGAIPSGFTERRQGVYELYSRIAADAQDKLRKPFSFVRSFKRASRAVRMFIVAKRATREAAVNGTVVPVGGAASAMAILEA